MICKLFEGISLWNYGKASRPSSSSSQRNHRSKVQHWSWFSSFFSSLPQKCHSQKLMSQKCLKIFIFFSIFFARNNYSSTYQWHFWGKPDFYVCISIYFLFILCAFVFSAQEFQSNWLATDTGISLCYESILWQPGDRRMC